LESCLCSRDEKQAYDQEAQLLDLLLAEDKAL
jgi:hypothetical protein